MKHHYAMIVCGLLSTSCATTDDPREGGLMGGAHGLSSGAYDQRIKDREESLQRLQEMQQELNTEQRELEMGKAQRQARLDAVQNRLTRLDRETEQLILDLRNKRSLLGEEKEKQARLEQDLSALHRSIAGLEQKTAAGGSVASLEAERDRLEEEYRLLLDLYLELGK